MSNCSLDGMQWNPGRIGHAYPTPDFATLHPGYIIEFPLSRE